MGSLHVPPGYIAALICKSPHWFLLRVGYKMERKEGFAETTHKLLSLGAKDTPSYLQTAFGANSDTAGVVVHEVGALALDDEPIHGGDGIDPPAVEMNTIEAEGKVAGEVPFYTKVRGKGKGQPVLYDTSRSSVAQIYGTSCLPPLQQSPPLFG